MTGNTLTDVSEPVHDHDAANKLYVDRRSGGTDKVSRSGDSMQGDLDMGGYRIAGLNTSLPPIHADAGCWSRAVELTREVGQRASEQVMDVKRLYDLKVSKTGDLMTKNLLLSADGGNDRLFGCTDLPHGNTFTCVFGDTLNRLHFTLTNPLTLESSNGLLVKCRGEDVCLMGNSSEIIIYKVIRMNSHSIINLPIPTLPHEAANKLYVDSNSRKILHGYVPPLRSMGGRNNINLGFIAAASSQLNNYYKASNAFNCFYTGRRTGGEWVSNNETKNF